MKTSEIITANRSQITETMIEKYRSVITHGGRIQYKVYIWEDGEIKCLEDIQGGNTFLAPKDHELRSLYYVTTVSAPYIDIWETAGETEPADEAEKVEKESEIIDWLMDEYKSSVDDIVDTAIEAAQQEEEYSERYAD